MSGGLIGLLDDIAALAKLAAASVDDVGAAAGKASAKAVGVVVDDTAVTPAYVQGLAAERELPIIRRIAVGSLRNKLLFILPAAILLSEIAPVLVEILLMIGGTYLCYEGAHKLLHALRHRGSGTDGHNATGSAAHASTATDATTHTAIAATDVADDVADDDATEQAVRDLTTEEEATIGGAIRTDFILSCEIMVIALKEVIHEPLFSRSVVLIVVALLITAAVYGVVALIVKMDDIGLRLIRNSGNDGSAIGSLLVNGMPVVLTWLSRIGTAAMLWVGGHILIAGADELGWHTPAAWLHDFADVFHGIAGVGGVLGWLAETLVSAIVGFAVGAVVVEIVERVPRRRSAAAH